MNSSTNAAGSLTIRDLGCADYAPVLAAMREFTLSRTAATPDELWLLEHPPLFTQGLAGKAEHVLAPGDIPVVQVDRGGQVTYHAPGQLLAYVLFDLQRARIGVRDMVERMENALIGLLAALDITAHARRDAPGVYVDERKIASLGLKIRQGRCYHGLALNVDMDLAPFARINPCGYRDLRMCQLRDFLPQAAVQTLKKPLALQLAGQLELEPVFMDDL
ncbi:MAG: lipoyl(octanoyl) transferase LipB [Pseudomonadota bacterium]